MKTFLTITISLFIVNASLGQDKYFSKNGEIRFFSKAPVEDIEAFSKSANAIFDTGNGEVVARVSIKTFEFEKKLMQEHFNENYLESDKYPRGEFKGVVKDFSIDDLPENIDSKYTVVGTLSIHGETKEIAIPVNLKLNGDRIRASSEFKISLKDYKIKIPKVVIKNIAEEIKITFDFDMNKLK